MNFLLDNYDNIVVVISGLIYGFVVGMAAWISPWLVAGMASAMFIWGGLSGE